MKQHGGGILNETFNMELFSEYLKQKKYAGQVIFFSTALSTQKEARNFVQHNGIQNAVFIADRQTDGQGRNGRKWLFVNGALTFSILSKPQISPSKLPLANYAAALAVKNVLLKHNIKTDIKWPNDLLINNRKFCGILSESSAVFDSILFLSTGFGINISDFPAELENESSSLQRETGIIFCRELLAAEIISEYIDLLQILEKSAEQLLLLYKTECNTLGNSVRVITGDNEITAVAEDINSDGSLLVNKNGEKLSFFAADVIHLRKA